MEGWGERYNMLEYKSAGNFCSKRPKRLLAQLRGHGQVETPPILQNDYERPLPALKWHQHDTDLIKPTEKEV